MSTELATAKDDNTAQQRVRKTSRLRGIEFPPAMESQFQQEMDRLRRRRDQLTAWVAVALYGLFGVSDHIMLPDVYQQAWAIRFLFVIPLMVLYAIGIGSVRSMLVREILMSSLVVITALSIAWIASLSHHPNAAHYHSGIALIVLFGNIVLKLRLRDAIGSSAVVTLLYGFVLMDIETMPAEVRINHWLVFVTAAVISLTANYRMEQDQRRAFLAKAREQERNEDLTHAVELLGKLSAEDPLTKIANRREFDRRLQLEWGRARREAQPLALILADVDFFKNYNDHYGHPAGDACLQQIASILRSVPQRSSDLVARLGGEEFAVLLPGTTIEDAAHLAESMRRAVLELNLPHAYSEVAPVVSASFGVAAMLPQMREEPAELLADADVALYNAKKNGRNRVVIHA